VSTPARQELGSRIIEMACLAPSVHNSQPWRWRLSDPDTVELWADRGRQLLETDPRGRNLALSCGAALHHGSVVARALGLTPDVILEPDPTDPDLLARIRLSPGVTPPDALESLELIGQRRTDRRRFTTWPVPDRRLTLLGRSAAGWGAYVVPLVEGSARRRTDNLLDRALRAQVSDGRATSEQPEGRDHGIVAQTDGLLAICTDRDDQGAWLRAGQALSTLWLRATRDGLSIVPLSQVIEVDETRDALANDVLGGQAHPQLLLRVGWQEISRSDLPRTTRRPLADVLVH
jgi:hypothetical protein